MKKVYNKPVVEIEAYTLSEAIAGSCGTTIDLGPGGLEPGEDTCDSWKGSMDMVSDVMLDNRSFYQSSCSCYYTSGNEGYITS